MRSAKVGTTQSCQSNKYLLTNYLSPGEDYNARTNSIQKLIDQNNTILDIGNDI